MEWNENVDLGMNGREVLRSKFQKIKNFKNKNLKK